MKIRQKMLAGIVAVFLLVGLVGGMGLYANDYTVKSFESGEAHYGHIVVAANEVSSYAKRAEGHIMLYVTLHDPADKQKFSQRIDSLRNQTSILDETVSNPDAMAIIKDIKNWTVELQAIGESLIAAHDAEFNANGTFTTESRTELRSLNTAASKIREDGVKLTTLETQLKTDAEQNAKDNAKILHSMIIAISLAAIAAALAIGYYLTISISRPIAKLNEAAAEIGKGNLGTKIDVSGSDEVGNLSATFNGMVGRLKESKKKMEDYNKSLESEVAARTQDIEKSRAVLEDYNKNLQKDVSERTAELEKSKDALEQKVNELERFQKIAVGRELKMVDMKKETAELKKKASGKAGK